MSDRLSLPELEAYLWGAATILRGLVDAGDYKQYVFPLLFYKRLSDVWDEEYATALADGGDVDYAREMANERFIIPDGAHWNDVRTVPRDVGLALRQAMRAIEAANPARLDSIFGDAPWTNKERLPDRTLKNLLEHFSAHVLSLANVPEDELGNAYEFLIKKFADDSGHTAQEFYTNRTVVHLMVQLLQPQPGESIYDPTAGTGGMLISALDEVKRGGGEHRTLRLYGQERNHMTAAIARMNLVLHGVEDFDIARGDTLERPAFTERDRLRTFDVVLANPPYSIKQWNRDAWQSDPWGRNFLGTPPQGRADYAFFQHILCSMDPQAGRCAILFPHGVLFRKEEAEMRQKLVEADLVECVLGLGPNLFYNSPMEACVIVCRSQKSPQRRGQILFIDAVNAVTRERAVSFLKPEHQQRIEAAYRTFQEAPSFLEGIEPGFARAASQAEIAKQGYSLSIPLYVKRLEHENGSGDARPLPELWAEWEQQGRLFWQEMDTLVEMLDNLPNLPGSSELPGRSLKPGWTWVKFGDVVRLNTDRIADPAASGIERYVGLEHIEPEDLRIRRWGLVAEGTTFTNYFKPGQTLFGKRRAYQRKVAVADFAGVCSGDIYVFEPKDDCLLPELLPFICQTERFYEYAVGTSAGSLSPRTNWTQLAQYEFALPTLAEQRRFIKLLRAASNVCSTFLDLKDAGEGLMSSFRKQLSSVDSYKKNFAQIGLPGYEGPWKNVKISDILEMHREQVNVIADTVYCEIGIRSFGRGVFIKEPVTGNDLGNKRVFWTQPGALILNIVFAWEGAVAITPPETAGLIVSHRFPMYFAKDDEVDIRYVKDYLLTPDGLGKLRRASPGGAGRNRTLGQNAFLNISIPLPPIEKQQEIVQQIENIKTANHEVATRLTNAQNLLSRCKKIT